MERSKDADHGRERARVVRSPPEELRRHRVPRPSGQPPQEWSRKQKQEKLLPGVPDDDCPSLDRHICGSHVVAAGGAI